MKLKITTNFYTLKFEARSTVQGWRGIASHALHTNFCLWSVNHVIYSYKAFIEIKHAKHVDTKFPLLKRLVFFSLIG